MKFSKVHFKQNISLAWPMALNALLMQSMVIIDLMLVAPLGEISVAALGIAVAIAAFVLGTQHALANGTQMVLARAFGAQNHDKIAIDMAAGWVANVGFSLFTVIALALGGRSLLERVADNSAVISGASDYLYVMLPMVIISSLTQVMIVYFNASRKTRIPLYGFMIEIPLNALLSLVLIHGLFGAPAMGLTGAALGSLSAVVIRLLYLTAQLYREKNLNCKSGLNQLDKSTLKKHIHEIWPIAANFMTLMGGMTLFQMLFAQLEVHAYAAITLVFPWMKFGFQFVNSWAQATAINVSQYLGKGDKQAIPEFVEQAVWVTMFMSVLLVAGFFGFSLLIPVLYPQMEPETLQVLAIIAHVYIAMPIVRTYNTLCGHTLRALGESFMVLRIHATAQWAIALPVCAAAIYFDAPVLLVFGVVFFEEVIKTLPFRMLLVRKLRYLRGQEQRGEVI